MSARVQNIGSTIATGAIISLLFMLGKGENRFHDDYLYVSNFSLNHGFKMLHEEDLSCQAWPWCLD